ncbi:hypothetical protein IIA79_04950, partial [bacterium]|nr:hypothetical protein [bacterium]
MSVLRINQNPIAINASRNLKITGMAIAKSLERLSSGLRINRAADDAAGLSISEKLRAQIRGLNRASSNALDGISLIQTAEGALNEVHSILQRMRELSVQAANGIYTSGDRAAIQLEVGQLTDEINRIAKATEFNSKTLLDGSLGALISTDDYSRLSAAVVGNVGNGGNFVLKAVAKSTGQLQVQKTDVFSTTQATDAVGQINYLATFRADATVTTAGADGIGNTGIYQIEVPVDGLGSVAVQSTVDGSLRISGATGAINAHTLGQLLQSEELSVGDKVLLTLNTTTGVTTVSVTILSLATTVSIFSDQVSTALGTLTTGVSFVSTAGTTAFSIGLAAGVSIINTQFSDVDGSGSDFYLSFSSAGASNRFFTSFTFSFFNSGSSTSATTSRAAGTSGVFFSFGSAGTGSIDVRFDVRFDWSQVSLAGSTLTDTIAWNKFSGGSSLQDYGRVWQDGPVPVNFTLLISAVSSRTYAVFSFNNQAYTSLVGAGQDQNFAILAARGSQIGSTTSIAATFDGTGTILENVNITFDGILQEGETATFNMSTNNVLTGDQLNTLASLNRFQDFGVFNGTNNVELTLFLRGTDSSATINISKNDTYEDLANKISLAIWNPEGTGIINSGILNSEQMPDLVHVNTIGMAKGTMSIATPVPGAEIVFSGDEELLKALSLLEIQEGASPVYSINAFNLEKNISVGNVTVDSNEINGLLPGLKIFFDNTLGLKLN